MHCFARLFLCKPLRLPSSKSYNLLVDIFTSIAKEAENFLTKKGLPAKVKIDEPPSQAVNADRVYIAMQEYGIDPLLKNHLPNPDDPEPGPNFAHLISFFVLPVSKSYKMRLQLLEAIVELFETKPFFNMMIRNNEYELSISMKSPSAPDYQQFWLALQQPSQPVVFYQARVSST